MTPKSAVVVPLYMYPLTAETWKPLHRAIATHPDLQFVVIINPNSGPGAPPFPDASYALEIPKLNAQANVRTIGYVRCDYCKRSIQALYEEVAIYGAWSKDHARTGVFVQGIFIDETPNESSAAIRTYLDAISHTIKSTSGILGERLVMHNPGTLPDAGMSTASLDVTVVLEESFATYESRTPLQLGKLQQYNRAGCCYIMHCVPAQDIKRLVHDLRSKAAYIFVTDNLECYYQSFGPSWDIFIDAMAKGSCMSNLRQIARNKAA